MKHITAILAVFLISCTTDFTYVDNSNSNPWLGVHIADSFDITHCENTPSGWECEQYTVPGDINGCYYTLEGVVSFEGSNNGFGTVQLLLNTDCSYSDAFFLFFWYIYNAEDNSFLVNFFEDSDMFHADLLEEDGKLTFTINVEGTNEKTIFKFKLQQEDSGCVSIEHLDMGYCYAEPNCTMRLNGCYSETTCDYALYVMNLPGSFETEDGSCIN